MTKRWTAVLATVAVTGALAGCSSSSKHDNTDSLKPKKPAPVELAVDTPSSTPVKVGVIWTQSGEGSEWRLGASGAEIAAYRYSGLGKADVQVVPAEDKGTAAGAAAAVDALVKDGVAGIVLASSGAHIDGALTAAAAAGVPVLLPYDTTVTPGPGAWSTGASAKQVGAAVTEALDQAGASQPAVLLGKGYAAQGVDAAMTRTIDAGNLAATVKELAEASDKQTIDSVVVWGDAATDAAAVAAVEGALPGTPIVVSPEATSGAFDLALTKAGGIVPPGLFTVGTNTSDPSALVPGAAGDAAAAFFSAVRLAATAGSSTKAVDGSPLAGVASYVDIASHDAVIALVAAATEAGSTDPAAVSKTLATLTLGSTDGLAGPELDFTSPAAVADEAVEPLQATAQDPGVRPAVALTEGQTRVGRVFWFATPTAG